MQTMNSLYNSNVHLCGIFSCEGCKLEVNNSSHYLYRRAILMGGRDFFSQIDRIDFYSCLSPNVGDVCIYLSFFFITVMYLSFVMGQNTFCAPHLFILLIKKEGRIKLRAGEEREKETWTTRKERGRGFENQGLEAIFNVI